MHGYSSIYNLGHKMAANLFMNEVTIEEKVDGSQFSFGVFLDDAGVPQLKIRSKGSELFHPVENKLFKAACDYVYSIQNLLVYGWTYRGEVLFREKHNSLKYGRTPKHNVIIFDIDKGDCDYLNYDQKSVEAARLDLEVVPLLFKGKVEDSEFLRDFFERDSFLGEAKIEGMVFKNYSQYGADKKTLMGKWVSEAFKEVHRTEWKKSNPGRKDVIENLVAMYKTEPRWVKAIQHLQEQGLIQNAPQDIGPLMKEVSTDILKECKDEIKDKLFEMAWPTISRGVCAGLPEFYKNRLAQLQFLSQVPSAQCESSPL